MSLPNHATGCACKPGFRCDSSRATDSESQGKGPTRIKGNKGTVVFKKPMTMLLIASSLAVAACNTVRGAGQDLESAANCTENAIKTGACR